MSSSNSLEDDFRLFRLSTSLEGLNGVGLELVVALKCLVQTDHLQWIGFGERIYKLRSEFPL